MKKERILLVDDDPDILEIIQYNLEKEGFKVYTSDSGKAAIKLAVKKKPALIILDVMMPDMDGMETCFQMRNIPELQDTLITFLTARNEDYSHIAGFDAGADDYITKPIKPRVLISKIKATLRRKNRDDDEVNNSTAEGISLDRERYIVKKNEEEIILPKKEFELLSLLMQKPGKVYSREKIMTKIWGDGIIVGERTIDVHIRKLRQRLGEDCIITISGIGYKFKS